MENDTYTFSTEQKLSNGSVTTITVTGNEVAITKVMRDFRSFLLACSYGEELVEQYLPASDDDY